MTFEEYKQAKAELCEVKASLGGCMNDDDVIRHAQGLFAKLPSADLSLRQLVRERLIEKERELTRIIGEYLQAQNEQNSWNNQPN